MRVMFKESGDWKLMPHKLEEDIAACVVQSERRGGREALVVLDEWEGACVACGDTAALMRAAVRTEELLGGWMARLLRVYSGNEERKRNVRGN